MASIDAALAAAAAATDPRGAASALHALCAASLPPAPASAEILDEHSFDLFDAVLRCAKISRACMGKAERVLTGLCEAASAREIFCMVMGAFSNERSPRLQLLLLRTLARVVPNLKRKRADFLATCLTSLNARFLDSWPGAVWDEDLSLIHI